MSTRQTDERLKSYLDSNQMHREQMCLAILALDKRFSDVRPRHPRGGPDGGRDIEANFKKSDLAYGAVGFINQAADVKENKRTISKKFSDDLVSAWNALPQPSVFIFFTNVNFTADEKNKLVEKAKKIGFGFCEILDRERLRISLDSPDGFAARFQYLGIAMSDSEQASFFAKWGDEIQSIVATGFQEVHNTLAQMLFLQEASGPIEELVFEFKFDRQYDAIEINHFRAFCLLSLRHPKQETASILVGSSDKLYRFNLEDSEEKSNALPGIESGFSYAQWVVRWPTSHEAYKLQLKDPKVMFALTHNGSCVGTDRMGSITARYQPKGRTLEPNLCLMDLDNSDFLPIVNKSLAGKIERIRIYSKGYVLSDISKKDFLIDESEIKLDIDEAFSESEMHDPWVRLRQSNGVSVFSLSFSNVVPVRTFKAKKAIS